MDTALSSWEIKVCHLMDYIDQHISEDLSLEVLAQRVECSGAHLVRMFQHETGETPGDFVRRIRLERAANYLGQNKLVPLVEIALACGFQSAAVFSRSFKDWFGITPSQWRGGAHWRRCLNQMCWRPSCGDCTSGVEDYPDDPRIQSLKFHVLERGKPDSLDFSGIRIVELPVMKLAYLRGFNASRIGAWLSLWQRFREWEVGIRPQSRQPLTAVAHLLDNHSICQKQNTRIDLGIVLDENLGGGAEPCKRIEGGRYALLPFRGDWVDETLAYEYASLALPAILNVNLDFHRPFLKIFDLSPFAPGELPDIASKQGYEAFIAFPIRSENRAIPEWWYRPSRSLMD